MRQPRFRYPLVVFIFITLPMHQVLCSPSIFPMLPDFFYLIFLFFINNCQQSAGSSCCSLNFGSTHCVSRSSLKTLWIIHPSRSSSSNASNSMSFKILNGPYLLLSSFFEGQFEWIFLLSSHTLSLTFNP